ncbi:MAG: YcxB family protein [Cytophagaceae bacterium]
MNEQTKETQPIEISIDLTRDDYGDFNRFWFQKKGLKKRLYIVAFMALTFPFLFNSDHPFHLLNYIFEVALVAIIFGSIYIGGMYLIVSRTGKYPSENGSILGKRTFIITEEGLIEESETNKTLQRWKGIKGVETNKRSVFIFVDNIAAYIIPKRFFTSEQEQNAFIKAIKDRL